MRWWELGRERERQKERKKIQGEKVENSELKVNKGRRKRGLAKTWLLTGNLENAQNPCMP